MKLLCTADLHYRLPQLDWLVEQAGDVDVVVIPGDHLQVVGAAPLEVQIVVVSKYLQRLSEQALVLASSGNHDLDGPGPTGEQATEWLRGLASDRLVVDGQSTDVDGVRFTVCPWWDGTQTRQLVEDQLAAAAVDRPDRWIWVYHSPPADSPLCQAGSKAYPDPDLAAWIDRWHRLSSGLRRPVAFARLHAGALGRPARAAHPATTDAAADARSARAGAHAVRLAHRGRRIQPGVRFRHFKPWGSAGAPDRARSAAWPVGRRGRED